MSQLQDAGGLALLVSCTQGKTLATPANLKLGTLPLGAARAEAWKERLRTEPLRPLRQLYKGQQWQASLALEEAARAKRRHVDLWVMSAGLGLRLADGMAPGYAASFSPGVDSVGQSAEERGAWWASLAAISDVASLDDFLGRYSDVLVVLSPAYLSVLSPGLEASQCKNWLVMSSGRSNKIHYLSSQGLRTALGGSDASLNQRAAQQLLRLAGSRGLRSNGVLSLWNDWSREHRSPRTPSGQPLADPAVRQLIRTWIGESQASATQLLRRLRESGFACEQRRFSRLYAEELRRAA